MSDFEKVLELKIDTTRAVAALKKLDKRIEGLDKSTKKVGKTFSKKIGKDSVKATEKLEKAVKKTSISLKKLGNGMAKVGKKLTTHLTLPIAALGGLSIKMSMDFNKAMANVSTLLTGGIGQVRRYKKAVQDMSVETGKSTTDLAGGMYQVVSALGESTQNFDQLGVAAKAAVAGVSDTKSAITLLAGAANAYNETGAEAIEKTSDLAFMAVKLGVTTFPQLAESMGKVTPLAASFNTSQEELFATIATGTKVGTETSEVVTQMSSIYSAFLKPTSQLTAIAKKHRYESAKAMMADKGLRNTLILLNKEVDGNSEKMAKLLKRKEANVLATLLLGGQAENYKNILGEMQNAVGSTDEAYRKQTEGINAQGHSWDKTKRRMERFSQIIGDKLLPAFDKLLDRINPIIKYFEDMDDSTLDLTVSIAAFVAVLGPAIMVIGKVVAALGALKAALVVLVPFVLANPVVLVLAAITGAAALLYKYWDEVVAGFKHGILSIGGFFESVWIDIQRYVNFIIGAASSVKEFFGGDAIKFRLDTSDAQKRFDWMQEQKANIDWRSSEQKGVQSDLDNATGQTSANIKKYSSGGESAISDEWTMQSMAGNASGGGGSQSVTTNINLNVTGQVDPKKLANEVGKVVDRKMGGQLKRSSRKAGAGI